jgi:tetratricopeptide (TPR) repeat protein
MTEFEFVTRAEPANAQGHLGLARSNIFFVIDVNEKLNEYKYVEITGKPQFPVIDIHKNLDDAPPGSKISIPNGDMQQLQEAKQRATKEYRETLRIDPTLSDAMAELGDIIVSENAVEGFALIDNALKINPHNALANWIKGEDHLSRGRFFEAFQHLARAVRAEQENHKYWFSFARLCEKIGYPDQAIDGYFHVTALKPKHRDALFNLGTLFFGKKDIFMARKFWGEFLAIEPDSDDAAYIHRIFPDLNT